MTNKRNDLGFARHTNDLAVEELYDGLDPLLLQRKGRLILLATENVDKEILTWLCRDFYESRSFDVIPSLVHTLTQAYRDHPTLSADLPLVVALRGLDVYMVGTRDAVVRLVRYSVVRDLFNAAAKRTGFRVAMTRHSLTPTTPPLYSSQWRLVSGDVLLMTNQAAAQKLGVGKLTRMLRLTRSAQKAAVTLGHLSRVSQSAPLIVLQHAAPSPVPEMPTTVKTPSEAPAVPKSHHRRGFSPIWPALAIVMISLLFTLWATDLHVNLADGELSEYFLLVFFPERTPTEVPEEVLPEETEEVAPVLIYPAPVLTSPYTGARLQGDELTLVWEWEMTLGPDEFYEVILWPAGNDPEARTLTRNQRHNVSRGSTGWYSWSVRVVNGQDREALVPLSPEAERASFMWSNVEVSPSP